jgi:hypothetical protein
MAGAPGPQNPPPRGRAFFPPPARSESGSAEVDLETLKLAWIGLERAANHGAAPETYRPLADAAMRLIQRLRARAGEAGPGVWRATGFEAQERVWTGQEVGWGAVCCVRPAAWASARVQVSCSMAGSGLAVRLPAQGTTAAALQL